MPSKVVFPTKSLIICVMADDSTVNGFLLTGIGERTDKQKNYMIVTKETSDDDIIKEFSGYLARNDVGIILIA